MDPYLYLHLFRPAVGRGSKGTRGNQLPPPTVHGQDHPGYTGPQSFHPGNQALDLSCKSKVWHFVPPCGGVVRRSNIFLIRRYKTDEIYKRVIHLEYNVKFNIAYTHSAWVSCFSYLTVLHDVNLY